MNLSEMFPQPEKVTLVHGVTREAKIYVLYPPDCESMSLLEERFDMPFRDFFLGGRIMKQDGKPVVAETTATGEITYQRDGAGVQWDSASHVAFLLWLFAHQGDEQLTEAEVRKQLNLYNLDTAVSAVCRTLAKARATSDKIKSRRSS